jgi:hypothetical protein
MDIRMESYLEATKSYTSEAAEHVDFGELEPWNFIRKHKLSPTLNANPADYPAGTWFVYPEGRGEGVCYVK